ncbi:hypothetical protein R327_12470 [Salmonella enterica]|nr:hypothetical protein [Salmonella enterica]EDW8141255.1 hypothetical protein [Salmonella enterica subsp. enterica serovar Miami]EAW7772061.1 hypothetical protein [Salmonella enterica]EAY4613190.1 hypothetical protein [Salmonella enterica]EAY4645479.1 hypothetical protein [Salmonella enterica]
MTTITRERLLKIQQWRETYGTGSNVMLPAEEAEELARIALASLEENEFIPKNLDKALGVVGVALPESKEEFNFQIERWIQRLIDRVIRYADEFKEQPAPVVPPAIEPDYKVIKSILPTANPDEYACCIAADMWNACRSAMLNGGKL